MKRFSLCISLFIYFFTGASSQLKNSSSGIFHDAVNDPRIKTVQLFREGWNLSYPAIRLNENEKLVFGFDLLAEEPETYYYSLIHCDRNWKGSDIFPNDYLTGLTEDQIDDYRPSFNTTVKYYHYSLSFPNERIGLRLSGNYIIKVYSAGNPDNPVLTRRFTVSEDAVRISAEAHRPQLTESYNTGQQIELSIDFSGMKINDPYREISTYILQNGRWNNARADLRPDFVSNNSVSFKSLSDKTIFPGGNEFRYFDIKSLRYQSQYIRKIDFNGSGYQVFLFPSENREFKPYFHWQDFNGRYYVAVQEGRNMDTDADYVTVSFTMPSKYRIEGGKIYVAGAFNNWALGKDNLMIYDPEKAEYHCSMLLKQGWYNYEYLFLKDGESNAFASVFEGNHYETENDYLILVYYSNPRYRYDRLIGYAITNTVNR